MARTHVLDAKILWKNSKGRPIKTWNENVASSLNNRGKSRKKAKMMATDRRKWRSFVKEKLVAAQ